ncbi:MAG: DUF6036 family nucleotidyltransferase [Gaiellaceae bacterium]
MRREEFEHVVRAAATIVGDEIVVVGSQAVLAQYPDAPEPLLRSLEVDLYPRSEPERSEEIDGAIGDGSPFHELFAYFAHGVGPETVTAPAGWEDRLVRLELPPLRRKGGPVIAWCLEVHDLVLAKLAAGREHDIEFAFEAIRGELVDADRLRIGLGLMPESHREVTTERLEGLLSRVRRVKSP